MVLFSLTYISFVFFVVVVNAAYEASIQNSYASPSESFSGRTTVAGRQTGKEESKQAVRLTGKQINRQARKAERDAHRQRKRCRQGYRGSYSR